MTGARVPQEWAERRTPSGCTAQQALSATEMFPGKKKTSCHEVGRCRRGQAPSTPSCLSQPGDTHSSPPARSVLTARRHLSLLLMTAGEETVKVEWWGTQKVRIRVPGSTIQWPFTHDTRLTPSWYLNPNVMAFTHTVTNPVISPNLGVIAEVEVTYQLTDTVARITDVTSMWHLHKETRQNSCSVLYMSLLTQKDAGFSSGVWKSV